MEVLVSVASTAWLVAGLVMLARLAIRGGYRALLAVAAALAVLVGVGRVLDTLLDMPRAAARLMQVAASVSTLLLVPALKRLVEQISGTGAEAALTRDAFLIGAFWLGTDRFGLVCQLLPVNIGPREVPGLLVAQHDPDGRLLPPVDDARRTAPHLPPAGGAA